MLPKSFIPDQGGNIQLPRSFIPETAAPAQSQNVVASQVPLQRPSFLDHPEEIGPTSTFGNLRQDIPIGIGKSLSNTVAGIQELGAKALKRIAPDSMQGSLDSAIQDAQNARPFLQPSDESERIGTVAGDILQTALPFSKIQQAGRTIGAGMKFLPRVLTRAGIEGTGGAAIGAIQSGGDPNEMAKNALLSAAFPILGETGRTLKNAAPLAGTVDKQAVKLGAKYGIDLPVSAVNQNKGLALFEGAASRLPFGQPIADRATQAMDNITSLANGIIQKSKDPSVIGKTIATAKDRLIQKYHDTVDNLYSKIDLKAFGKESIQAQKTLEVLKRNLAAEKSASKVYPEGSNAEFYQNMIDKLEGKTIQLKNSKNALYSKFIPPDASPENVKNALRKMNQDLKASYQRTSPIPTGDLAKLREIKNALNEDFKAAIQVINPIMAKRLNIADEFYGKNIQKLNDGVFKTVENLSDKPDKLFEFVTGKGISSEEIPDIIKTLKPREVKELQSSALSGILENAKSKVGNNHLMQSGIENKMRSLGKEKIEALFTPKQIEFLDDLKDLTKSMRGLQKVTDGSQTSFLSSKIAQIVAGGSALFSPVIVGKILGIMGASGYAARKVIMSPSFKKMVQRGASSGTASKNSILKTTLKSGTQAVAQDGSQNG